jgi:hypothetical protein
MQTNGAPPPPGGGSGSVAPGTDPAANPCLLLGVRKGARDAYSVLASFGGHFSGGTAGGASAQGGVSQYFATGMAAQLLALNGGAAVVSSGPAADSASRNAPMTLDGALGTTPATEAGIKAANSYPDFETALLKRVNAAPSDAALAASFAKLESDAGLKATTVQASCATRAACVTAISDGDYRQTYYMHSEALEAALKQW